MSKDHPLSHRLYYDPLLTELAKAVGYIGFPVCELAQRLKPLARKYGARKLSAAIFEILSLAGNRVMLNDKVRSLSYMMLGPAPEDWDRHYRHPNGEPMPRPPGKETLPIIPEREIDPITDSLRSMTVTQLDMMLRQAWVKQRSDMPHVADLAREQIPRIESEMLRRGEEIPEEPSEESQEEAKPAKKRTKKAKE